MPFRRVLVATDFSEPSRVAANVADRLVGEDAAVAFVHVLAGPTDLPLATPPEIRDSYATTSSARADAATTRLRAFATDAGRADAEMRVAYGSPGRAVADDAKDWGADLVVLASRGLSGLERLLLGSTARGVLRHAGTSTLIVRGEAPTLSEPVVRRMVLATDFHGPARAAAAVAREIAKRQGADILLTHVVDPRLWGDVVEMTPPAGHEHTTASLTGAVKEELTKFNRTELDGAAREIVAEGHPRDGVIDVVERERADLVVVGSHGPGALERVLVGSVAEGVAERAPSSVLVVRA